MNKVDVEKHIDKPQYAEINKSLAQSISSILADDELNDKQKLYLISKVMQVFDAVDELLNYYKILLRANDTEDKHE